MMGEKEFWELERSFAKCFLAFLSISPLLLALSDAQRLQMMYQHV